MKLKFSIEPANFFYSAADMGEPETAPEIPSRLTEGICYEAVSGISPEVISGVASNV